MLDFADLPYEFVPAKPSRVLMALAGVVNRCMALPGRNHRVGEIVVEGGEGIARALREEGARLVFLPNHSTHSDPQVMTEVCRRLGMRPSFMAAYDVFARSRLRGWLMQRLGAFSVDREGGDRRAMKFACDLLAGGRHPLVLFPEGNVYLCNDRVTPFAEGAAYIALRAQKAVGGDGPVYAVPVSLKLTFVEDVREVVRGELGGLARRFGSALDGQADILEELKRISMAGLARHLRQRGYIAPESTLSADAQIRQAVEQLVVGLERKMELGPRKGDDLRGRVRRIRACVHAVRTDRDREADHRVAVHWADEAMLALRMLGYLGGYTAENPSLDRVAETVARLREDVTAELARPIGMRRALVRIGCPIDLREHLAGFQARARGAIAELTGQCEAAVQEGMDAINGMNDAEGGRRF